VVGLRFSQEDLSLDLAGYRLAVTSYSRGIQYVRMMNNAEPPPSHHSGKKERNCQRRRIGMRNDGKLSKTWPHQFRKNAYSTRKCQLEVSTRISRKLVLSAPDLMCLRLLVSYCICAASVTENQTKISQLTMSYFLGTESGTYKVVMGCPLTYNVFVYQLGQTACRQGEDRS
jgi:hypothetical protein